MDLPGSTAQSYPLHTLLSPKYTKKAEHKIKKEILNLKRLGFEGKLAYVLHNVFSKEECEDLIKETEKLGYTQALIHSGEGAYHVKGYRDSQRVMVDDVQFCQILFQRIGHRLPQTWQPSRKSPIYKLKEINERLRFLRYDPGDQFKAHSDGTYTRPDFSARTFITLQIYLNEGMGGGETTFLSVLADSSKSENRMPVVPKIGAVLVFEHNILHEGSLVTEGKKYTVRTDVLYEVDKNAKGKSAEEEDEDDEDEEKKSLRENKNCSLI